MIYIILNLKISKNNNILLLKNFLTLLSKIILLFLLALKIKLMHISKNQNN